MDEEQIFKEQIKGLPEELKQFLARDKWLSDIKEIARKNNFTDDQTTSFINETSFVLTGMDLKDNFAKNIQTELVIPELLAKDIAEEINERIFKEVSDFLPKEIEKDAEATQATEPKLPPSDHLIETAEGNRDNIINESQLRTAETPAPSTNQAPAAPIVPKISSEEIDRAVQASKATVQINPEPAPAKTFGARIMEKVVKPAEDAPKPQAQAWGTVVDQRLSAQSEPLKNTGSSAQTARIVNPPVNNQYKVGEDPYRIKPE